MEIQTCFIHTVKYYIKRPFLKLIIKKMDPWPLNLQEFGLGQYPTPQSTISVIDLTRSATPSDNERLESLGTNTGSSLFTSENLVGSPHSRRFSGMDHTGNLPEATPPNLTSVRRRLVFPTRSLNMVRSPLTGTPQGTGMLLNRAQSPAILTPSRVMYTFAVITPSGFK